MLRRYWTLDERTLERAFEADIPPHVAERGLPMAVQLALAVATRRSELGASSALQLYALETVECAVSRGLPGIGPKDLHELTGELDPFHIA